MFVFSGILEGLMGSVFGIAIVIICIVIIFKVAKEIVGFLIKLGLILVVIYLLLNYTGLFGYIQSILGDFNIL